jgi:hypothetical protein
LRSGQYARWIARLRGLTPLLLLVALVAARPGQPAPEVTGGPWINGPPLAPAALRGRVVLVEFWTYG